MSKTSQKVIKPKASPPMWRPVEDLSHVYDLLASLEQGLLAVYRRTLSVNELVGREFLARLWEWVDSNPYQALLMTRLKSSHAMTPRHSINVMLMARAWAGLRHRLGAKLDDFSIAALFHDLGHWRPDDLVYIRDFFSHEQVRRLRGHVCLEEMDTPVLTGEILSWIGQHHEQPDGNGYPNGIRDPHPLAQVLRIVDCFDGLTTGRAFRKAYSYPDAMAIMRRWSGHKFSDSLFLSFRAFLGAFPVGTFVRMKDGTAGITLPPAEGLEQVLLLTNDQGDPLPILRDPVVVAGGIEGENTFWSGTNLEREFKNIRPDLFGRRMGGR